MFKLKGKQRPIDIPEAVTDQYMGYTRPGRLIPEWRVQFLVFQGGNSRIRLGSMTGGGQLYGHEPAGAFMPVLVNYGTPITSVVAGGQVVSKPAWLTSLFGGSSGSSS